MSKRRKTGFQYKLFDIVSDSPSQIIGWDTDGVTFSIRNRDRLQNEVLGKYFRHNNFDSFLRQLGFYSFQRIETHQTEGSTFRNPNFRRGRRDLLQNLKRRTYADEGLREDVKKLQNEVTELRNGFHELRSVMMQMRQQVTNMNAALSARGLVRPITSTAVSSVTTTQPTAGLSSPAGWQHASIPANIPSSLDLGDSGVASAFGSAQFSIDVGASGTMIPDDEGAEHLLPMGMTSFSTGSRFGASGGEVSSALSITEEPAHKMVRRQEPVAANVPIQWGNSTFGSSAARDSFGSFSLQSP